MSAAAVAFQSPKYIQQAGALQRVGEFAAESFKDARKAGILTSARLRSRYMEAMCQSVDSPVIAEFSGECSRSNLQSILQKMQGQQLDYIIGFGGGKLLDMAKLVAHETQLPVVVVPSLASTDAPCTALSVVYSDAGVVEEVVYFPASPAMVVVDTAVIAEAPAVFLVAGMGDAMATWYEARAVVRNPAAFTKIAPLTYRPPRIAAAIARECADVLFQHGIQAAADCTARTVSDALEAVVEANILLSGLGVECGGLAVAHGLHNALTRLPETHSLMHGQKVAFGTLVQLMLEGDEAEFKRVLAFNKAVGLPTCLSDLNLSPEAGDKLGVVAAACVAKGNLCLNMPMPLTAEQMKSAILATDAAGRAAKE